MTTDETNVLRALELGLTLAEAELAEAHCTIPDKKFKDFHSQWIKHAEADVRDIKYAIRLVEAWR